MSFTLNAVFHPVTTAIHSSEHAADLIRQHACVRVHGAGTKPGLIGADGDKVVTLNTTTLTGVVDYEPSEYVISVQAGTPLREMNAILAASGQYLPCDPLLVENGATIGGTIAANAFGPGSVRYGSLRDFIIGIRFIDGQGRIQRGGGRVVKNAAGFDFPKLFTGSQGRLGVMTEATFKVFPRPEAFLTARATMPDLREALALVATLRTRPYDLDAIEVTSHAEVILRIGGEAEALKPRLERLVRETATSFEPLPDDEATDLWQSFTHPEPADDADRLRLSLRLGGALEVAEHLKQLGVLFRLSAAATLVEILWPRAMPWPDLTGKKPQNLDAPMPPPENPFLTRLRNALDPQRKFAD